MVAVLQRINFFTSLVFVFIFATMSAAKGLDIEVLKAVPECKLFAKNGDKLQIHYRGTLGSNGQEFDASYNR